MRKSSLLRLSFLLDANLSRKLIPVLTDKLNLTVHHISEYLDDDATDEEIIRLAQKRHFIIITHDLDYGEIYYLQKQGKFGVIILRLTDQTSDSVLERLISFFEKLSYINQDLNESLIIITDDKIRIVDGF